MNFLERVEYMDKFDVIIVGGGGSGLTAAIYASRADLKTLLLENEAPGGQISITDVVENYPGFPEGISGPEIAMKMEDQAKKYGTLIIVEKAENVERSGNYIRVKTAKNVYEGKTLIIASGAKMRWLHVPGEKEHMGRGVSYCAICDGALFRNKNVVVVGGGDSAVQEALFLSRFAKKVKIIHRRDKLRAGSYLQKRAFENEKIEIVWDHVVTSIEGEGKVERVMLKNVKTGEKKDLPTDGVFIFIGHNPASDFIKGFVKLDEDGYVLTDTDYETSEPGVFACGEVRKGAVKQLIAACGEGCAAALKAEDFIEKQTEKKG